MKFTQEEINAFLEEYKTLCEKHGMQLATQFVVKTYTPANETIETLQ